MAILSIQSHVVFGYAGNSSAVFPMQRLGREVWAINTVDFSNHSGYGVWKGKVHGAELVTELVSGLEDRAVLGHCEAVLSGYLGDASVGRAIVEAVKTVRKYSPDALYCCDPVMGDAERGIYVKPDIPDIIRKELIPLADITCPNLFELEILTGVKISNTEDAVRAINILHEMGPSVVLVTSFKEKDKELSILASNKNEIFKITTPELPIGQGVVGTGDMTTAIFLSRFLETKNIEKSLEMCISSIFSILEKSLMLSISGKNKLLELKQIEAQEEIISPSHFFSAEKII